MSEEEAPYHPIWEIEERLGIKSRLNPDRYPEPLRSTWWIEREKRKDRLMAEQTIPLHRIMMTRIQDAYVPVIEELYTRLDKAEEDRKALLTRFQEFVKNGNREGFEIRVDDDGFVDIPVRPEPKAVKDGK